MEIVMQKKGIIYLAGGCFWGVEEYLSQIPGVVSTEVGYANGKSQHPTYEDVCYKNTGHAEVVKVDYNSEEISLLEILDLFFLVIDPTTKNRQGNDIGTQYRSGIYYTDPADQRVIGAAIAKLAKKHIEPLQIEVFPLDNYHKAEERHQRYLKNNPLGYCHIGESEFQKARNYKPQKYHQKSKEELAASLTELQYHVTQEDGTEPPFNNKYNNHFEKGIYVDITSDAPLFSSLDKFSSNCGWPSFAKPIAEDSIAERVDNSHGMSRIEVRSQVGDAHLGHVFKESSGLRYCINSASLKFIPLKDMASEGYGEYLNLFE